LHALANLDASSVGRWSRLRRCGGRRCR